MELDHSGLFSQTKTEIAGGPPTAPEKKLTWTQRRAAEVDARRFYASHDLNSLLTLALSSKEIYAFSVKCLKTGSSMPLLQACAADCRSSWIRALWKDGARPADKQRASLILEAAAQSDAATVQSLLDLDPSLLFLRNPAQEDPYDPLYCAAWHKNAPALSVLLPAVAREAAKEGEVVNCAKTARRSWHLAQTHVASCSEMLATDGAGGQPTVAFMDTVAEFARHPQLYTPSRHPHLAPAHSPAERAARERNSAAVSSDDEPVTMPAFARALIEKIDSLHEKIDKMQRHIERQDERILALGETQARPAEASERPTSTPPLARLGLGLLSQRLRRAAPVEEAGASDSSPAPKNGP